MRTATLILILASLLAASAAAQQQSCPPIEPAPPICERFDGSLSFRSAGDFRQVDVVMRQWQIANETTVEISHRGFLIVHVRAGALVAEIGDKQEEWRADSYWSVEAKEPLIVRTARDSVLLQTVDFITQ
jgi:hypothetical protein